MRRPLPIGPFSTILADPPWRYRDKVNARLVKQIKASGYREKLPGRRGAEGFYETMSVEEICALPVSTRAAENSHLYLWTTNAFVEQAHQVARAWGFRPNTLITWKKPGIGMGYHWRNCTEHVLFAVRGKLRTRRRDLSTFFEAPRGIHSRKPDGFYYLIEEQSPGPYLEMFATRRRRRWRSWGDGLARRSR